MNRYRITYVEHHVTKYLGFYASLMDAYMDAKCEGIHLIDAMYQIECVKG